MWFRIVDVAIVQIVTVAAVFGSESMGEAVEKTAAVADGRGNVGKKSFFFAFPSSQNGILKRLALIADLAAVLRRFLSWRRLTRRP